MSANPNGGTQMFWTRKSDGKTYCFSPVPLLAESKERIQNANNEYGSRLATITTLTFNGYLLPELPALSGVNPDATCIELLDRKSDQLELALSEDRGNLLIVDGSGYTIYNVHPMVRSLSFDEGQIVTHRKYSLVFEFESNYGEAKIRSFDENWSFQQNEDDTYTVSHAVNAQGIPDFPAATGSLQNAKNFVLPRLNSVNKNNAPYSTVPYVNSLIDINTFSAYNHIRTENANEANGTYDVSETWLMSSGNFKDDRTITIDGQADEFGNISETINVAGTIQGYGDTTFEKFNRATTAWTNIVAPEIGFYASSGIASRSKVENRFAGTVNYNISKSVSGSDALENRSIQRSFQFNEDGSVTQTVTTSAKVRNGSLSGINIAEDFCLANNYPIDSTLPPFSVSLSGNIETVSKQVDAITKSFSLTRAFREGGQLAWREEYEISREQSLENALTSVTVNGTVYGLIAEPTTSSIARFYAASGAFYSIIEPIIRDRAILMLDGNICLGTNPIRETLGYNQKAGRITYSYTYDSRNINSNPNILSENIEVSYRLPTDVYANIAIPAKATGPILQDQQTVTSRSKSIKIQYNMAASGVSGACAPQNVNTRALLEQAALDESNILVNNTALQHARGEKPTGTVFKNQDEYTFSPQGNVFTRNVSWEY